MLHRLAIIIVNVLFTSTVWALPDGFVYVDQEVPGILTQLRYASSDNFIGRNVNGYISERAVLTRPAAKALADVQSDLRSFGLELFIFDAYRPQRAVEDFVAWAKDLKDTSTKAKYYPKVAKENLFAEGYIADRSGHSRGSTIDLTIVSSFPPFKPLDMGTNFDFFGLESWPKFSGVLPEQRANRLLLRTLMLKHGFRPYEMEWWHFTYEKEPFPETYFNFIVD